MEVDITGKVLGVLKEGFDNCTQETQTAVKVFLAKAGQAGLTIKDVSVPLHKYGMSPPGGVFLFEQRLKCVML